ncbi:MAG: DUF4396 domain-containing protein [Candidatus Rokuibacteriota bacterium]
MHDHHAKGAPLNRLALSATVHCLTGCAIGEVLGMVIGVGWAGAISPRWRCPSSWRSSCQSVAHHARSRSRPRAASSLTVVVEMPVSYGAAR